MLLMRTNRRWLLRSKCKDARSLKGRAERIVVTRLGQDFATQLGARR
jgi:hypothetical protein